MSITFEPIGIIKTPFEEKKGMPIQPAAAKGIKGAIEIYNQYIKGLDDLDGFSYIYLIYHLHRSEGFNLKVIPFLDNTPRGLFSTRAPKRPNQIGLSVVKLISINKNILKIENVDILDGTPLLDIKPYISGFDKLESEKEGWIQDKKNKIPTKKSDTRFN